MRGCWETGASGAEGKGPPGQNGGRQDEALPVLGGPQGIQRGMMGTQAGGMVGTGGSDSAILMDVTSGQAAPHPQPSHNSHISSRRLSVWETTDCFVRTARHRHVCRPARGGHCRSPPWGKANGRNKKGNLINSFHIQHFPHSIIFKLNNLSLEEKGKFPLSSAQPHKAHIVGP